MRRLFLAVLAVLFAQSSHVVAYDPMAGIKVDEVTVSDWREIGGWNDPTTSDCLGQNTSPICIADTMVACDTWTPSSGRMPEADETWLGGFHPICDSLRIVPGNPDVYPWTFRRPIANPKFVKRRYRVMTVPMKPLSNPEHALINRYVPVEGDVAIAVYIKTCVPEFGTALPREEGMPYAYPEGTPLTSCLFYPIPRAEAAWFLRPTSSRSWRMVDYFFPHRTEYWDGLMELYSRLVR